MDQPQIIIRIDRYQLEVINKELDRLFALISNPQTDKVDKDWAKGRVVELQDSLRTIKDGQLIQFPNSKKLA